MNSHYHKQAIPYKYGVALLLALIIALVVTSAMPPAIAEAPQVKSFHLYATDGYATMPDGKQLYIWGYSAVNVPGTAMTPAPTLEANEGDTIEVTVSNIGPSLKGGKKLAHTIHFHGMDTDQLNDGVPHTSAAIQVGESFTYRFTAKASGTYFYHCHVDTVEHLQMGMYGALIVKAKGGVNEAWTGGPAYDKEYVFLLNEIDPSWHEAVEQGKPYDRTDYHPRYWTINGKAYPDTESDPTTMIEGKVGETVLVRMINAGYESHSFHMHGYHFQIIASDGRPLKEPITKDTVLIGPGERYDLLVMFDQDGQFPFHSHNIVDNTNDGAYPGGLHTMIDVEAADANAADTMDRTIELKAGSLKATVNGQSVELTPAPVEQKGITFVPLRFIGEQLGAKVTWLAKERSMLYETSGKKVQLWLGNSQAMVNGAITPLPAPPIQLKGVTLVPLRFISEQLGAKVQFNSGTGAITVSGTMSMTSAEHDHSPGDGTGAAGSGSGAGSGTDASTGGTDGTDGSTGADTGATGHEGHTGTEPSDDGSNGTGNGSVSGGTIADPLTVTITKSAFVPNKLTIKKGQTVTWVNQDAQIHTVYDLTDTFNSTNLLPSDVFKHTFNETGSFTYYCSTHPSMQAEIIVTD